MPFQGPCWRSCAGGIDVDVEFTLFSGSHSRRGTAASTVKRRLLAEISATRIQIEDPTWRVSQNNSRALFSWYGWRWATVHGNLPSAGVRLGRSP